MSKDRWKILSLISLSCQTDFQNNRKRKELKLPTKFIPDKHTTNSYRSNDVLHLKVMILIQREDTNDINKPETIKVTITIRTYNSCLFLLYFQLHLNQFAL